VSGDLVLELRAQLLRSLARHLPAARQVVLLDIPYHANVGDHAILLGELAALKALGKRVVHVHADAAGDFGRLRWRIGSRPILLHGGGNLGDLWPAHQAFRERVLTEFPDHPVVQLPQSIAFADDSAVVRARETFRAHPRFALLVRDVESVAFAEDRLNTPAQLVPDAAFALGRLRRRGPPQRELLVLARTDHERRPGRRLPEGIAAEDWLTPRLRREDRVRQGIADALNRRAGRSEQVSTALARAAMLAWARVSAAHVDRGLRLLCSARVVVTDRLHAHVLCLLLGIPHAVTDSASGKIRAFWETWTRDSELVIWADSLERGIELGQEHLLPQPGTR